MLGLDELIIGAFFNERPQFALPWMTSEVDGRQTKSINDVGGKDLTQCKTQDTYGETASPWNDLRSDSYLVKDADDRTFGERRTSNKGIISKEFSEEVMTKVALGELSVSNITSGYGHKVKAQKMKIPNDDKKITGVGFEELLSNNTKAVCGKANEFISDIYDNTKASYLDKAKSHFIEDKGCIGLKGRMNICSNEGNSNKIVDVELEEFIPRRTKSVLGDSLSDINMSVPGFETWRPYSSSTSCLSLQEGKSSIDTEKQNSFTDIHVSSCYKPRIVPWDEKKMENNSTKSDSDAHFSPVDRDIDRQKISDKSTYVGQMLLPHESATKVNLFEAALARNTIIPAGGAGKLDSQGKSYDRLLGIGKQVAEDEQLYKNHQRDDERSGTDIRDFTSPNAEMAYIPSFFLQKKPSLKTNYSIVETQCTVPKRLVEGALHKPAENFNTQRNVSADTKSLKKNDNSDKLEHEKLHVTKTSYSVQDFKKTNDIHPMFNRIDDKARGSKSEHSKLTVTPNPVTAWIIKAIDSGDTITEQVGDNIADDSYDVKNTIPRKPSDGQIKTVQKTRTPQNAKSPPRSLQGLTKTARVIVVEPEEIRRKRRKTKCERDKAADSVINQNCFTESDTHLDHVKFIKPQRSDVSQQNCFTESDTHLDYVKFIKTQRSDVSQQNCFTESDIHLDHVKFIKEQRSDVSQQSSVNGSKITINNKDGFKREYDSKMTEHVDPDDDTEEVFTAIKKSLRRLHDVTGFINDSAKQNNRLDPGRLETNLNWFMGRGDDINVQSEKRRCKRCRNELTPPLDSERLPMSTMTSDIVDDDKMKERIKLQKERPVPSDVYYQLINIVENLRLTNGAEALTRNKSIEQLLKTIYNCSGSTEHDIIDHTNKNGLAFGLCNGAMKGKETENVDDINVIQRLVPNVKPEYFDDDTGTTYPCDKSKLSSLKPEHDTQEETVGVSKPLTSTKRKVINFFKKLVCCKNVNETID